MWETILPFATLLGGTGFGELIKKYIYVGRAAGEGSPEASRGRPRVQVTGPKVQPEICQICMGRIKEGTEYVRCSNGKVFHSVCLARVGHCPYCKRTYAIKGRESSTTRDFVQPVIPADLPPGPEVGPKEIAAAQCPLCGRELEKDATGCPCGAIFVADGGSFACPECGFEVKEGDLFCGRCGERFHSVNCPVCGLPIPASAERCSCGGLLANRCPECGAMLAENAELCANCGTEFEFV